MNHDDEPDESTHQQDLLLDVLERRRSLDANEVRDAMALDPDFEARLRGALHVQDQLLALRQAEQDAVQAPTSALDAVAIAAARTGLGLDQPVVTTRRWPWLVLAFAASLMLGALLWRNLAPDRIELPRDQHLDVGLEITFDGGTGELVLPALPPGHSYQVEFVAGGTVVQQVPNLRTARMVLPPLASHAGPMLVRVQLRQAGDPVGPRGEATVPPGMLR